MFGDSRLRGLPPYEVLLDEDFYGEPIILETEPDQEFLGFMLETKPLELICQGPYQHLPSLISVLGFSTQSPLEWMSIPLPHCRQRSISGLPCSTTKLETTSDFCSCVWRFWCWIKIWEEMVWSSSLGKPARVYKWINWLSPCLLSFVLLLLCVVLSSPCCVSLAQTRFPVFRHRVLYFTMDHAQGREFHHHLARARMHLNCLAGLLPFFERNHQSNGMTHPAKTILVLGVQIQPHEIFIHLFLFLALPQHRQWHLMGAFPPIWYWTQNRTFGHLTLPAVHAMMRATLPLGLPHEIRLQQPVLHQSLFQGYQHLTSLVQQPEQQRLSLFDQNKDQILPKIHNQRRNSVRSSRRISRPYALPYSSTNHWRSSSWRLQFRGLRRRSGLQGPLSPDHVSSWRWPCHHFADWQPNHLQELQLQQILHRTPPFASSNRQNPTGAILLRLSALGQTLKTKNWSISRMTVNHALHGNRLAPDYDVILRRAKFVGTFWSKCPTSMARRRLDTNQRQRTKRQRVKKM